MTAPLRLFIVGLVLCSCVTLHAQVEVIDDTSSSMPWLRISGNASLSSDFYTYTSDPLGTQIGRRPAALHRLVFTPTISIGSWLSLPLNLMITYPETNTTTPSIQTPSLAEMFTNPANAFGLSSFSPKLGWAQFHLGSHTPRFSELSGGDLQLFGGGVDLRPGNLQIAASYGVSQRAVEPDATRNSQGAYRRDMTMMRAAFGNQDSAAVGINIVHAKDDVSSIRNSILSIIPARPLEDDSTVTLPADTVRMRAEEGAIASVDLKFVVAPGTTLTAEGAVSAFTRDLSSPLLAMEGNPVSSLFTTRTSTRVDGAASASLALRYSTWGVTFSGLYMGAGFEPLGYPFSQSDRIDVKISPMLNLLDGALTFNGTIGQRINNLSETKGQQLTQAIINGQLSVQFSESFSLTSTYSNFGIRNNRQNPLDSARVQNVSESFSIDPAITFDASEIIHTLMLSVGIDRYDDFNIVSGVESSNDTRSATIAYTGIVQSMPLTYGITGSYLENALSAGTLTIRSIGANASYRLLSGALTPTMSMTFSGSSLGPNPADTQTFVKAGLRWRISQQLTLTGNYAVNSYEYGSGGSRGSRFSENMIQLAVSTSF